MNYKQILNVAIDIGYMLLKSGAEVYRAEQSVEYICKSYGIEKVDVFAIPSSIIVTINFDDDFISKTKRVYDIEINLEKVSKLNELSRYICENTPEYENVQAKIEAIEKIRPYFFLHKTLAFGLIGLSFTALFNATWIESLIGFLVGVIISFIMKLSEKRNFNPFLKTTLCSFVLSIISLLCGLFSNGFIDSTSIISGTLMILVPGLELTNCMRDFMAKDFMSGTAKLSQTLMVAIATALGVSIALVVFRGLSTALCYL